MGGFLILLAMAVSTLLWADLTNRYVWAVLLVTAGFGFVGFVDDYLKVTRANVRGVPGKIKLLLEVAIAVIAALWISAVMNAGAYGAEFRDVLVDATAIDGQGTVHNVTMADLGMSYRHTDAPADWIFVEAVLRGQAGTREAISARLAEVSAARQDSQPVKTSTGGSTFKNPDGARA